MVRKAAVRDSRWTMRRCPSACSHRSPASVSVFLGGFFFIFCIFVVMNVCVCASLSGVNAD